MRLFYTLLFIICSSQAMSQIVTPIIGVNYGKDNDEYVGLTHRPALRIVGGLGTEIEISPSLDFIPSLLYSVKGGNFVNGSNNAIYKQHCTYLAVPLLFDYNLKSFGLNFGLVTSYWLSERTKYLGPNGKQIFILNFTDPGISSSGHYNRLELALELGARYRLETSGLTMNFYLSYKHAVTPQYQPDNPQANYNYLYNRWVQLKVGIPIKISV